MARNYSVRLDQATYDRLTSGGLSLRDAITAAAATPAPTPTTIERDVTGNADQLGRLVDVHVTINYYAAGSSSGRE